MEITVEVTELDHNDFYRSYSIKRKWLQHLLFLLAIDLILSALIPLTAYYLVTLVFMGLCLAPFFFGIPYLINKNRIRKFYEQTFSPNGKKTFKPFATGIEITEESGTTFLNHENITETGRSGNYIYLMTRYTGCYLLPLSCFFSEYEAAHFLKLTTSGIAQAKGIPPKAPLTFKPIYLVGLLCFIPLLGFLAGLILLILGIVHFKDKVFIVVGAFGMLFTVAIYGSLFYFATNTAVFRDGFVDIAQTEVNELVKSVEFYKLQNGSYPDSLQQLNTKGSFVVIDDPLTAAKFGDKTSPFRYEKKGTKYLLFSVGKDGKPNTADDIYPNLTNADTSKLGFIRKSM